MARLCLLYCGPSLDRTYEGSTGRYVLSDSDAERIQIDITSALAYLHDNGVFHCDIKPDNISWDPVKRKATLLDFGFAAGPKLEECRTQHRQRVEPDYSAFPRRRRRRRGRLAGTPGFLPPELAVINEHSAEGDIWAFGCPSHDAQCSIQSQDFEIESRCRW